MEGIRTALVMQGGGAYGAYELGAFRALWEWELRPDVVTGVSIGGINAAVIAGYDEKQFTNPAAALDALWEELTVVSPPGVPNTVNHLLSLPGNPGMYAPNPDVDITPLTATSFSDLAPLRETVNALVDWDRLNDETRSVRLAVTGLNVKTGKLSVFRNYPEEAARPEDHGPHLNADHLLASGSLPPGFPMTPIGEEPYWDGGQFNNTPLKPAFKALQTLPEGDKIEVSRRIIVLALFPPGGAIPENLAEVNAGKTETTFACNMDHDIALYHKIDAFRTFAQEVEKVLTTKQKKAFGKLPGFQKLLKYKPVQPIIRIDLKKSEEDPGSALLPGADFTRRTIRARADRGYEKTLADLKAEGI